ncbi:HAUS augmin-like complex subunit 3 isoform X2 [Lissotriton helveticus]
MFAQRKSRSSTLDGVKSRGSAFVETLQRIGYPKAADLQGNSFDWLYEDLESAHFLNWFCGLDESNVVSQTEIKAFQQLQAAKETIMVEEELEQAVSSWQMSMTSSAVEGWGLEKEVKHLRCLKERQNTVLDKVRACCSIQAYQSNSLNDCVKNAERDLKKLYPKLGDENIKQNDTLSQTSKIIPKLIPWHDEYCRPPTTPLLFSENNLSQYNRLEDTCMKAVTEYIMLVKEASFNAAPMKEVTKEVLECSTENTNKDLEQELLQLEKNHVCRLREQLSLEATEHRTSAGLKYAEELLGLLSSQLPEWKVVGLGEQLHALEEDVAQLSVKLLSLIDENASYFRLPVLFADLDVDTVRLQYLSSKQEVMVCQILKQRSRQDVLALALDVELHNHGQTARLVEEIRSDLRAKISGLEERLTYMGNPSIFSQILPRPQIERKDQTVMRLCELLETPSNKPSITKYASMKHWTVALKQKLSALLSTPVIPQVQWTSLESELKKFHSQMYCSSKRFPLNHAKLSESMDELLNVVAQVEFIIDDFEEDLRKKKMSLYSQCCEHRNLYVYFFMDPRRLKEVLEEREYFADTFSGVPSEKE